MRGVVPTSRAKASISATVSPVISDAHSGVRVATWAANSGEKSVNCVEVGAILEPLAEEDVHHRERQRAVRAGTQHQAHVGLLHRRGAVDVDDDDLGAPLFPRADRVGHHVDLGV